MDFDITQPISVSLDWDYCEDVPNRQIGTHEEEDYLIEEEQFTISVHLYVRAVMDCDGGDYWNPPTYDIIDEDKEIYEVKVYNMEDEEIILDKTEEHKLIHQILDILDYE